MHLAKQQPDFETGSAEVLDQCCGKRAVGQGRTILRQCPFLGGIGNDLTGFGFNIAKPARSRSCAAIACKLERIVATGIQHHNPQFRCPRHRRAQGGQGNSLKLDIGGAQQFGINRHQIILVRHFNTVASIINDGDFRVFAAGREGLQLLPHRIGSEIVDMPHIIKACGFECAGYCLSIGNGVGEGADIRIIRIADDQRHALAGRMG